MIRWILLLHRYLGIAVGALMIMWCLSGIVMMYVSYPALPEDVRLRHLAPIVWDGCCKIPDALNADAQSVAGMEIEMFAGRPMLTLPGRYRRFDLLNGKEIDGISAAQARRTAEDFRGAAQSGPALQLLDLIGRDQWTVSGDFNSSRPLYRFAVGDPAGTQLYGSGVTGRAVQITTGRERFWNWLGAVPHWLYFTELRRHAPLWSQFVIYASLLGCFLTGIGIFLGVRQMAAQPSRQWSPYSGFNLWHHVAGLVFGVFTLAWVASGPLSMNPWGWLQGSGAEAESARIHGAGFGAADLAGALQKIAAAHPAISSLTAAPMNGRLYFIARKSNGEAERLNAEGLPAPLDSEDLAFLAHRAAEMRSSAALELLRSEDNYYFSHHREIAALPVYRLVLGSGMRYYFDSVSGMLIAKLDSPSRGYRWLHQGLHRLDFAAAVRSRPQWDALMLTLMAGVTLVCGTGAYLGYRRLTR
jgi:hypothetical protein